MNSGKRIRIGVYGCIVIGKRVADAAMEIGELRS